MIAETPRHRDSDSGELSQGSPKTERYWAAYSLNTALVSPSETGSDRLDALALAPTVLGDDWKTLRAQVRDLLEGGWKTSAKGRLHRDTGGHVGGHRRDREPVTRDLALQAAGVATDDRGFVKVDDRRRPAPRTRGRSETWRGARSSTPGPSDRGPIRRRPVVREKTGGLARAFSRALPPGYADRLPSGWKRPNRR
jgi:hypothetical protein